MALISYATLVVVFKDSNFNAALDSEELQFRQNEKGNAYHPSESVLNYLIGCTETQLTVSLSIIY